MLERRYMKLYTLAGTALACSILAVLTLISAEWIELTFGIEPDGGSGALEWLLVAALALSAALSAWFSNLEARRLSIHRWPRLDRVGE